MLASIQVALITNGDKGRLDYLEPRLANLEQVLSTRFDVHCFCIRFQPDQNPLLFPTSLIKDFLFQTTLSDWRVYCGGQRSRIKEGYQAAPVVVKHLLSRRTDRQKAATIEVAVTAKHIRAFDNFLESKRDFLFCIEDDILIEDKGAEKFLDLMSNVCLARCGYDSGLYVDLAGGLSFSDLGTQSLEVGTQFGCRKFRYPVTNTACAYLCNRHLVSAWANILLGNPLFRLLPIDWMINKLFLVMRDNGVPSICLHTAPPIFGHGSFEGKHEPWRASAASAHHQ